MRSPPIMFRRHWKTALCRCLLLAFILTAGLLQVVVWRSSSGTQARDVNAVLSAHESTESVPSHSYLGCQDVNGHQLSILKAHSSSMSVHLCASLCNRTQFYYALLQGGSNCYCSRIAGTGRVHIDSDCNIACSGNASQFCGGVNTASIYVVRIPDGHGEWTEWMSMEGSTIASRYRGCNRVDSNGTCHLAIQRRSDGELEKWETGLHHYFIGCFTMAGFQHADKIIPQSDWPNAAYECMNSCWSKKRRYMAFQTLGTSRWCMCVADIGTSLPLDTCSNLYGVQVFYTQKIRSSGRLHFAPQNPPKKVLLLGSVQSGSTFASSFLRHYPGAFFADEVDSPLVINWEAKIGPDKLSEMDNTFSTKILDPYLQCQIYRVPGIFVLNYPSLGKGNVGFDSFKECQTMYFSTNGISKCLPVLEESCRMSEMMTTKTTRFLNALSLSSFVKSHKDMFFIQVVRDPRNTIASRMSVSPSLELNLMYHAQVLCKETLQINSVFEQHQNGSHMLTVFYEDLLGAPQNTTLELYRSLGLAISPQTLDDLLQATQRNATLKTSEDSEGANKKEWQHQLNRQNIDLIDEHCAGVYSKFPQRYVKVQ